MDSQSLVKSYSFKTAPFAHQYSALEMGAAEKFFGFLMEQGTGKTKTTIDNAAMLYNIGRINAIAVIAPNGVHRDWVTKGVPVHLPDYIPRRCAYWASDMRASERKAMEALYAPGIALRVFTFNTESIAHDRAFKELKKFLMLNNAMLVVDESHRIKNHSSKVTKNVLKLANLAVVRRILTGTPIAEGPLDAFAQLMFLDPEILPTQSFTAFRARYAELLSQDSPLIRAIMEKTGAKFAPVMVATDRRGRPIYKNLDELRAIVKKHTFRVLKSECLDLPEKTYVKQSVDMHDKQRAAYRHVIKVVREGFESVEESNKPIAKLNAVMYLQRILSGVLPGAVSPSRTDEYLFDDPATNPRVQALLTNLESTAESCIIWCRYTYDVQSITKAINETDFGKNSVVSYYGEMDRAQRDDAVNRFQRGEVRFFVGNAEAGGTGLDLYMASQVHYYSNSFKLLTRLQSEDRAHRIGQKNRVLYVDYECEGTVDTKILNAFVDKKDVADAITGDQFQEWIQL